jgi:hypothetical protein
MSWHGGKGDAYRKVDMEKYNSNYDTIFNKGYNLFLDDVRNPNQAFLHGQNATLLEHTRTLAFQWTVVRSYEEFLETIYQKGLPRLVSLDNDLTDVHTKYYFSADNDYFDTAKFKDNGIACLEFLLNSGMNPEGIHVHTANHFAREYMQNKINDSIELRNNSNEQSK